MNRKIVLVFCAMLLLLLRNGDSISKDLVCG